MILKSHTALTLSDVTVNFPTSGVRITSTATILPARPSDVLLVLSCFYLCPVCVPLSLSVGYLAGEVL